MTPVKVEVLERLLQDTNYDEEKSRFLVNGFKNGFDIGYREPENRRDTSKNIPFRDGVGSPKELWDKIMDEVELGRYAGPFTEIPFENYIQSPVGLVPKAGNSGKTRQIFHLSCDFKNGNKSVNHHIPSEWCSVKYNDLDHAVQIALRFMEKGAISLRFAKTDLRSAFRILPLHLKCFRWLILKAVNPEDGLTSFFLREMFAFRIKH